MYWQEYKIGNSGGTAQDKSAVLVVDKGKLVRIVTRYDLMENAYRKSPRVVK